MKKQNTYARLNNEIMRRNPDGTFPLEKDKEAARAYFLEHVNQNTVFFHTLKEKLNYLIENEYYEPEVFNRYSDKQLKKLYERAYSYKFRFPSFMGAFKFYNDYALKTNDGEKILERYEDRVVAVAAFLSLKAKVDEDGNPRIVGADFDKAMRYVDWMIRDGGQPATPTFLNAARKRRGELVSCFLLEVGDSLNDINMGESTAKQLSKVGGGVSTNLTRVRARGESIKDIENATKGVVGVVKMLDVAIRYADQQGQRSGAGAAYLHALHADILAFIDMKKVTADEDVRAKTLSLGTVIPDILIKLAEEDKKVALFYPHSIYKAYGTYFDEMDLNEMYDELVNNPKVRKRMIGARNLMTQIAIARIETGYPFLMFEDNVNRVHALDSKVRFSNLCTEILQKSIPSVYNDYGVEDEIGLDISCNLASINISKSMRGDLGNIFTLGVDALTQVSIFSSINNAPAVRKANRTMRSIGLGALDLHGYLVSVGIPYESAEARDFANVYFSLMNYHTLKRSMEMAKETGFTFDSFETSSYADGTYFDRYLAKSPEFMPQSDKVAKLFEKQFLPTNADWMRLKEAIKKHGLFHSYRLAIAPTGSISYVQSATAAVMPIMERIEERTYGNSKTYYPMPGLGAGNWFMYKEAYDMDMLKVIDMIATIQHHVDQGISFTFFVKDTVTTRDIVRYDLYAHSQGIKTIYYVRNRETGIDACLSCSV